MRLAFGSSHGHRSHGDERPLNPQASKPAPSTRLLKPFQCWGFSRTGGIPPHLLEDFIMLRFTGSELHAVLAEAGINGCKVMLVKDHGVYLMAEIGESKPDGS